MFDLKFDFQIRKILVHTITDKQLLLESLSISCTFACLSIKPSDRQTYNALKAYNEWMNEWLNDWMNE